MEWLTLGLFVALFISIVFNIRLRSKYMSALDALISRDHTECTKLRDLFKYKHPEKDFLEYTIKSFDMLDH